MPRLSIRPITAEDLRAVALIHRAAFSASALAALGPEAVRRYYQWQLEGPHDVVATAITEDGALRGFCFAGVFRGALSGFVRRNRTYLIWRLVSRPWLALHPSVRGKVGLALRALRERPAPIPAVPPTANADSTFMVLSIGVHPDSQGLGLGSRLLQHAEAVARGRGFQRMGLTVGPDNERAIRVYEKAGWTRTQSGTGWAGAMVKPLRPTPKTRC